MKTLKVEGIYPLEFETAADVAEQLPAFIENYNARRLRSSLAYLRPEQYEKQYARTSVKDAPNCVRPKGPTPFRVQNADTCGHALQQILRVPTMSPKPLEAQRNLVGAQGLEPWTR